MGDLYHLLCIYRYKLSTRPGRAQEALREDREIVAALARRDAVVVEAAMRKHLRSARKSVKEELAVESSDAIAINTAQPTAR